MLRCYWRVSHSCRTGCSLAWCKFSISCMWHSELTFLSALATETNRRFLSTHQVVKSLVTSGYSQFFSSNESVIVVVCSPPLFEIDFCWHVNCGQVQLWKGVGMRNQAAPNSTPCAAATDDNHTYAYWSTRWREGRSVSAMFVAVDNQAHLSSQSWPPEGPLVERWKGEQS